MHFNIAALSLFVAAAAAQTTNSTSDESLAQLISQLPTCARSCYISAAQSSGCGITDFECICITKRSDFIGAIAPCVIIGGGCSQTDQTEATNVATDFCHQMYASPNSTELAAASSAAISVLGTPTPTPSGSSNNNGSNAAARPAIGLGLLSAGVLLALAL